LTWGILANSPAQQDINGRRQINSQCAFVSLSGNVHKQVFKQSHEKNRSARVGGIIRYSFVKR